ncbi:thiopeptide maturation pyridine synthase [Streptomyces sp. NPDC052396]|uniref:thiopeptide maturation pyridine synthase n=1 Tax=Streptomyces sp. NPDC052396 TaxID=3365689 RepID=UPI0037CF740F
MTPAEHRWHSIHVHHHDEPAEPDLVLDAVRPAFEAVGDVITRGWFGRHWLRGPHLRLNFLTEPADWERTVRPTVTGLMEAYLREHPSRARLDEAELEPVHRRLALLEMEPGPVRPWIPDNTVREQPYDHRLPVLGSMRASELLADFLGDTNDMAFRMYADLRGTAALPVLALDLMWTTVAATAIPFRRDEAPIARGILSLRSHADAFLSRTRDPDAYRERFDERYRRQRPALAARLGAVEATLAGTAPDGAAVPFVAEWAEMVRRHQRAAHPLLASGEMSMRGAAVAPRMPTRQLSAFHRLLRSGHGHEDFVTDDQWFASFRLVVNYLYVHLNRMGLKPVDRALLCHLAARTVETVHAVSAADAFERYVMSAPGDEEPEWARLGAEWADEAH